MTASRCFTQRELAFFDGYDCMSHVACESKVYDVLTNFIWKKGRHWVRHHAGQDLKDAPHDADLLDRFPLVGVLID